MSEKVKDGAASTDRGIDFQEMSEKFGPIFLMITEVLLKLDDVVLFAYQKGLEFWEFLSPYHPEELVPAVVGILLVFFGGTFAVLIQAIEAARLFGFNKTMQSLRVLFRQLAIARDAYERDNKVDEDKDGVADVKQIDTKQLAIRKMTLFLRTVDPQELATALEGLTQAWLAIIGTLRIKFAQAITLGSSIGNALHKYLSPLIIKTVGHLVPKDYKRWFPIVLQYTFRYIGVSLAFYIVRIVSAVFMGMKGAELFIVGTTNYLVRHSYLSGDYIDTGSWMVSAAFTALALFGAYWQISSNFSLPFPLNILLLPLSILERVLLFAVGSQGLTTSPAAADGGVQG